MSIVRLRKVFRKKLQVRVGKKRISVGSPMEILFWLIIVIFVVGAFYTFGGPASPGGGEAGKEGQRKVSTVVAVVDDQKIQRAEYEAALEMSRRSMPPGQALTSDRYLKMNVLEGMIDRILKTAAAEKENIKVSGADVDKKVDEMVQQTIERSYPTRRALAKYLAKNRMTQDQYKAKIRSEYTQNREQILETVRFDKLEQKVKDAVKVSDKDLEDSYAKAKARHILIMPDKLREADQQAQGDKNQAQPAKDYKALAKKKAEDLLARIQKGEDFAKLAQENSDDPGSAKDGGLLVTQKPPQPGQTEPEKSEYFGRGEMVPEFDKACFALNPGQVSNVIETSYGFHILQLLDKKTELPADFAQKKEDYRKQLTEQRKTEAWTEFTQNLKKAAKIQIQDPELAAYKALDENDKANAIQLLNKAKNDDPTNMGARYQLAILLRENGDKDGALALFKELTEDQNAVSTPDVHMSLASLYEEKNMKQQAIDAYKAASDWALAYEWQNFMVHQQVKSKLEALGAKDLAAEEQKWLDEFQKESQNNPMGGGMPMMPNMPIQGGQ